MNCLKYCAVVFASLFLSLACGNDGGTAVSEPEDPEQPETPGQSEESEGLVVEIPNSGFERKWILRELPESGKRRTHGDRSCRIHL